MSQYKHKKLRDKLLNDYVGPLEQSVYFRFDFSNSLNKCLKNLGTTRHVNSIVCYGLGSFCNGIDSASRYQLALLILIHQSLSDISPQLSDTIDIYDPSFKPPFLLFD